MEVRVDTLGAVLSDYITAAAALLEDHERPVNRIVDIAPGVTPAWDDSCSQIYSRIVQIQPVVDQNMRGGGMMPCGISFYVATVALAVTRCVATVSDKGKRIVLPSAAQVTADGMTMLADLADLEQVIRCHEYTRSVVGGQPLPEAGGLAGFEWIFTIRLAPCACPPDVPETPPED